MWTLRSHFRNQGSCLGYDGIVESQNTSQSPGLTKWTFGLTDTQVIPGFGDFNDTYLFELFSSTAPWYAPAPGVARNGTLIAGGGSGCTTPAYIDAPYDAFVRQARVDGTFLAWDFYNQDPYVNAASDACVVSINAIASEGWDRPNLADAYSDKLITNVAAQCANTMVVIHSAGIRLVDAWIENPNVTAVIYAHLPGQDSGQALVDVMYGTQSPSGRLPYTVAKTPSDYGITLGPVIPDSTSEWHTQDNFTEGVFIDYKYFIANNITPRFEFGFGLTYTAFSYSDLSMQKSGYTRATLSNSSGVGSEGGDPALWQIIATISFTLTNSGSVATAEVAQLYIHIPGGPEKVLRGFYKRFLQPRESFPITFEMTTRDMSSWDVVSQTWVLPKGQYGLFVGKSVLDVQPQGSLSV